MNGAPRSALVVRLSSIGDVVHTVPAFSALREAWPNCRLGWVVEPAAAPLVRALPGPLQVHVIDTSRWRRRAWQPGTWSAVRAAGRELRDADYEIALDFQGLIKSAWVARSSGAKVYGLAPADVREHLALRWYDKTAPPLPAGGHIIERSLALVRSAGAAVDSSAPRGSGASINAARLPPVFAEEDIRHVDQELARRNIDGFVVAHGAANWSSKQWPLRHQAAAGREIYQRTGMKILWAWGPGEELSARRTAAAAGEGNLAAFPTSLTQLAALLSRARGFVGGDSAPLHLAIACGTPTVAFFGPTDPQRLGPIDDRDIVVTSQQPCSFCHQRRCPLGTRACLETLTPTAVAEALARRLATATATSQVV